MHPGEIHGVEQFVEALDVARRRAARGTGRRQVSITDLARRTGIPRSTVHVYLTGRTLPPSDALDALLQALGVDGADLRAWADALERLSARPPATEADPPTRPMPRVPRQLPPARPGLVGRAIEDAALDALLDERRDDVAPLVVAVTGAGGVGKTTFVGSWAARHLAEFPDGQLWIDLHGFGTRAPVDPSAALGRLLRACGIDTAQLPADVESRAELFRSTVADRRMLVVLDNAADSAHVHELLPGAPGCIVAVTSRSELRSLVAGTGATRLRLRPLDLDAGRLVLLSGGAAPLPTHLADRLVRQCGGLPLALRIVADRVVGRSVEDVEALTHDLDDRRQRLEALEVADGHDTFGVRSVLQSSVDALTAEVAQVFRVLPLCLGNTIRAENVAACIDESLVVARRRLDALVAVSLAREVARDRYAVDDLVATFADELRRTGPSDAAADRRLLRQLTSRALTVSVELDTGWDVRWPLVSAEDRGRPEPVAVDAPEEWLADSLDLLAAVIDRALGRGDVEDGWRLLGLILRTVIDRHDPSPFLSALETVRDHARAAGDLVLEARALRALGVALGSSARFPAAVEALERLLEVAIHLDDAPLIRVAEGNLAHIDYLAGRPQRALDRFLGMLPDDGRYGMTHLSAANGALTAAVLVGDLDTASRFAAVAVDLIDAEPVEFPWKRAQVYLNDAWVRLERGDAPEAVVSRVEDARRAGGAQFGEGLVTMAASVEAMALLTAGRPDAAADALLPVLALAAAQVSPEAMDVQIVQALLLQHTGRVAAAAAAARQTAERAARLSMPYQQAKALVVLAGAEAALGETSAARAHGLAASDLAAQGRFAAIDRRARAVVEVPDARALA